MSLFHLDLLFLLTQSFTVNCFDLKWPLNSLFREIGCVSNYSKFISNNYTTERPQGTDVSWEGRCSTNVFLSVIHDDLSTAWLFSPQFYFSAHAVLQFEQDCFFSLSQQFSTKCDFPTSQERGINDPCSTVQKPSLNSSKKDTSSDFQTQDPLDIWPWSMHIYTSHATLNIWKKEHYTRT